MNLSVQPLSDAARRKLSAVGSRFAAAGFPNPFGFALATDEVRGVSEELAECGLITRENDAATFHLTADGRSWILDDLGMVVVFCPKCSGDDYVAKGDRAAGALCPICGVGWTEDTTVEPFVPRYG